MAWEIYRANLAKEIPTLEKIMGQIKANYETEKSIARTRNRMQNMRAKWERGAINDLLGVIGGRNIPANRCDAIRS